MGAGVVCAACAWYLVCSELIPQTAHIVRNREGVRPVMLCRRTLYVPWGPVPEEISPHGKNVHAPHRLVANHLRHTIV